MSNKRACMNNWIYFDALHVLPQKGAASLTHFTPNNACCEFLVQI